MNPSALSRRTVLRAAGALVALPWLPSLAPRTFLGRQQADSLPLRMAFFYVPNGMHMPDWTPQQLGRDFSLPRTLEPVAEFRPQLNILSGLTLNGARALGDGPGDHARSVAAFLTGAHPKKTDGAGIRNGVSVDQIAAQHLGHLTRLPSLELGSEQSAPAGRCDSGYSCVYTSNISWKSDTAPVPKEVNPGAVFDRMFGSPDERQSQAARQRRDEYRKSILDAVRGEAATLRQKLSTGDRRQMDQYLQSVREVERRLSGTEKLDRAEPAVPDYPRPAGVPRDYEQHIKLLFDIMALAFQTDSTRIISFMFANAGSNRSYRNLDIRDGHHDLSHHGNDESKMQKISRINQYHMSLFAHFLQRLRAVTEGEHSLLDNCLLVYGSGIADGNRHAHHGLPIMTVGSGGGRFLTGQHLQYPRETPLTNLYLAILGQAGVSVESIGDSSGPLADIRA